MASAKTVYLSRAVASLFTLAQPFLWGTPAQAGDVVGKVTVGYQGWFVSPNDGSPKEAAIGNSYESHSIYIDFYPDLREFPTYPAAASEKFPGKFYNLPNGNPGSMFSSARAWTVNQHAAWMHQYGIDTVAMQRFWQSVDGDPASTRNDTVVENLVNNACAANHLKFYIEYDLSGTNTAAATSTQSEPNRNAHWVNEIEDDWQHLANSNDNTPLYQSAMYAREDGKPVVELWGIGNGQENIDPSTTNSVAIINYFKSRGCYVIVGTNVGWLVPENPTEQAHNGSPLPGFLPVLGLCDAINPWATSAFTMTAEADAYAENNMMQELNWCRSHQPPIDYIPDVWPGLSSHNEGIGSGNLHPPDIDTIPRLHGALMWEQFYNVRRLGIPSCFIGMFDEVNEGTAILKTAEDASMIPTGPYPFVPLSQDGVTISADFYLRLASDGGAMMKGLLPLRRVQPTPFTNDLFTTGFELGQPQPSWRDSVIADANVASPVCSVRTNEIAEDSATSLLVQGIGSGSSAIFCYCKVFDTSAKPLPINHRSLLYYWIYPVSDGTYTRSQHVGVDFVCSDGTTLRDCGAVDQNGNKIGPGAGHGGALTMNAWNIVTCDLSLLAGKTITQILIGYESGGTAGHYKAYVDDVEITAGTPLNSLLNGQTLHPGESMYSRDGHAKLCMQLDNNLVLYDVGGGDAVPKWQTNTAQQNPVRLAHAVLQADGNFVVKTDAEVLWASGTDTKQDQNDSVQLQPNGNLAICTIQGQVTWATGTRF